MNVLHQARMISGAHTGKEAGVVLKTEEYGEIFLVEQK